MTEYAERLAERPALDSPGEGDLLDVLEERLKLLVGRHRVALSESDDQRRQVAGRDRTIAELNARIASLEKLRAEAVGRVERLIDEVDRLERELDAEVGA
ncbi:MAG: hypothetical protein V3R91_11060 [Myxococcota bacterium]